MESMQKEERRPMKGGIGRWLLGSEKTKRSADHSSEDDGAVLEPGVLQAQVRRLHELNLLALLLHSAGTVEEMMAHFLERAPEITGAKIVYPLLLDRRRDVLHAKPLEGTNDPRLDQASLAFEAEMTQLEFPLYLRSTRRIVLEARPGGGRSRPAELRERTEAAGCQEAGDGAACHRRRAPGSHHLHV
jgi:hypothetical protein